MSFGSNDRMVSVRFNSFEQKELDYVVEKSGLFYRLPVSTVIKNLVHQAYLDFKTKEDKKKK